MLKGPNQQDCPRCRLIKRCGEAQIVAWFAPRELADVLRLSVRGVARSGHRASNEFVDQIVKG